MASIEHKVVYGCDKSHSPGGDYPLLIFNEGTPEWIHSGVGNLASQIPAEQILDLLLESDGLSPDRRGNIQLNFGLAGGQSHSRRTTESIIANVGTALPSHRSGSQNELVMDVMSIGTELARLLGFPWLMADAHEQVRRRLSMGAHECFKTNLIDLEHCTLLCNRLDGNKCTNEHSDDENCEKLPNVLNYAKLVERDNW